MNFASIVLLAALKYVFLFIGDGLSTPQRMLAEEFSVKTGGGRLAMNSLPHRACTATRSANAIVTDSAAAATAIACGEKTNNGVLGLAGDGRRLESVAEVAKKRGMKVGIITTVAIAHATPAGFYAHRRNRALYYQIGLDLVRSGFDCFAGAGLFGCQDDRDDPEYCGNIFELAHDAGYTVTHNISDWEALKPGGRSWSIFGNSSMHFDIDAQNDHPRLAALLEKTIGLLDNPNGFFIMCEGGKIDYAGHANDAATNLRDVLALDAAVKAAIAFQDRHPGETLIVTTGDHETGGMSMGLAGTGGAFNVEILARQRISTEKFSSQIKRLISKRKAQLSFGEVKPLLKDLFGLDNFSEQETKLLEEAFAKDVQNVKTRLEDTTAHDVQRRYVFAQTVKNVLSARAGVAWSTHSHTAMPTLTTAKGPGAAELMAGMSDNAEIGVRLKKLIGEKAQ
jgi:alkaline phosphatase